MDKACSKKYGVCAGMISFFLSAAFCLVGGCASYGLEISRGFPQNHPEAMVSFEGAICI